MTNFRYDLFISYAKQNKDIAEYVVERLEGKGLKCFIAPRDISTGADYAVEIVSAISNSTAVLLVFSQESDKSGYVLREINSAVSRNKTIIPLKIENFVPSEAMEFYLGVTQWLDAYPQILEVHLNDIMAIVKGIAKKDQSVSEEKEIAIKEPTLVRISRWLEMGYSFRDILMKEIELDYLCIPSDKYTMNDDTEGTVDEWLGAGSYEEDTSVLLIIGDEIKGFCDLYPVTEDAYAILREGRAIIRDDMMDLYELGGNFNMYIGMVAVSPEIESQKLYIMFFDWIIEHLKEWAEKGIFPINIGISVYSSMLEKFVQRFGFKYVGLNPAKGKIYEITKEELLSNESIKRRYGDFSL